MSYFKSKSPRNSTYFMMGIGQISKRCVSLPTYVDINPNKKIIYAFSENTLYAQTNISSIELICFRKQIIFSIRGF